MTHDERIRQRREALRRICAGIFAERTEFVWEIGCGHGHFLTAFAQAHPERLFVGVDIASDRIERADRKRDRAGLPHLHFVRADAADFLASLPEGASFSSLYILFPDPWPKRRHHKHRLMTPSFLAAAAERARPEARLYLKTDYEPYFRSARAAASAAGWQPVAEAWPFDTPTVFQNRADSFHAFVARRAPN